MKSSWETSGSGLWLMTVRWPVSRAWRTQAEGTPRPGHIFEYFVRTPAASRASRRRRASGVPPREATSMGSTSPNDGADAASWARRARTWPAVPPRAVWTACAREVVEGSGQAGRRSVWVRKTVPVANRRSGRGGTTACGDVWTVSRRRRAMRGRGRRRGRRGGRGRRRRVVYAVDEVVYVATQTGCSPLRSRSSSSSPLRPLVARRSSMALFRPAYRSLVGRVLLPLPPF